MAMVASFVVEFGTCRPVLPHVHSRVAFVLPISPCFMCGPFCRRYCVGTDKEIGSVSETLIRQHSRLGTHALYHTPLLSYLLQSGQGLFILFDYPRFPLHPPPPSANITPTVISTSLCALACRHCSLITPPTPS